MYAIVQKEQMGLDKAVEEVKFRMSRYSVTPNMLIIPPQLGLYMSLAPEAKLTYPLGGPAAQAAFDAGLKGFEASAFRGLGVLTSTPYEVSDDQDSVQMLQRSTQVGEFYRMGPPVVFPEKNELPSSYRDIMIYDEESDRHVHITFEQALYATGVGGAGGPETDVFKLKELSQELIEKFANHAVVCNFKGLTNTPLTKDQAEDWLRRLIAKATPGSSETPDQAQTRQLDIVRYIKEAVRAGVFFPIEICIARPFIEHLMLSAVVAVAGRDTGATLFGPADMQISANTSVKTIEGYACIPELLSTETHTI